MASPPKASHAFSQTVAAAFLFLSGCANAQQEVAGRQFKVPQDYLVDIPSSEVGGFLFILNPKARLEQQRSVLVQDRANVCARANGRGYVSQTVCGPKEIDWKDRSWRKSGDAYFWKYSPDTRSADEAPFVSCHKMEIEGHPGLCTATLPLGDLLLLISLRDDELGSLQARYDLAVLMLQSWEIKPQQTRS